MSTFKQIIWSLTDFEFLASLSYVDFHKRTCHIKPFFYNTLIGMIKNNVEIKSKNDLHRIIRFIKDLYSQRLGLVSPHSMVRFFRDNIKISFTSFRRRLEKFFDHEESSITPTQDVTNTKAEKKRLRRKAAKLRRRERKAEAITEPTLEIAEPLEEVEENEVFNKTDSSVPSDDVENESSVESEESVPVAEPLPSDVDSDLDRYEDLVNELETHPDWDNFCADFGEEALGTTKDRIIYESFLSWQSNQARIALDSDEE